MRPHAPADEWTFNSFAFDEAIGWLWFKHWNVQRQKVLKFCTKQRHIFAVAQQKNFVATGSTRKKNTLQRVQ